MQSLEPPREFGVGFGQDEIVGAQVGFRELREIPRVETVVVLGRALGAFVDPAADDLERLTVDLERGGVRLDAAGSGFPSADDDTVRG